MTIQYLGAEPLDKITFVEFDIDLSSFDRFIEEQLAPCLADEVLDEGDVKRGLLPAFTIVLGRKSAVRTDGSVVAILKPNDWFLELLATLKTGRVKFGDLKNVIDAKVRVLNESHHD